MASNKLIIIALFSFLIGCNTSKEKLPNLRGDCFVNLKTNTSPAEKFRFNTADARLLDSLNLCLSVNIDGDSAQVDCSTVKGDFYDFSSLLQGSSSLKLLQVENNTSLVPHGEEAMTYVFLKEGANYNKGLVYPGRVLGYYQSPGEQLPDIVLATPFNQRKNLAAIRFQLQEGRYRVKEVINIDGVPVGCAARDSIKRLFDVAQ